MKASIYLYGIFFVLITTLVYAQEKPKDAYKVFEKYFNAIGGLDKVKAEKSNYFEADFSLSGLSGTLKSWSEMPDKNRSELDLKIFTQVSGDNGEYSWTRDTNGKISINKDGATLKRRELARHMAEYEFLNPNSDIVNVKLLGVEDVNGTNCYAVEITNSINNDTLIEYYDSNNYLKVQSIDKRPDEQVYTVYSDYRDVDGLKKSFKQDVRVEPVGQLMSLQITDYASNPDIPDSLFNPPQIDVRDYKFASGGDSVQIPFKFMDDHIFMMVNINGKERPWVLDSGAGMSVITSKFAKELGLSESGSIKGSGAGNTVDVTFADVPSYQIGDIFFDSQKFAVIDLSDLVERTDYDIVGILGYDFLSRFITRIDFANEMLTFYEPEYFEYSGNGVEIEAPLNENIFHVETTVDGEYSGLWNIDLGAGSSSFHYPSCKKFSLLDRKGIEKYGMGAGGEFKDKAVKFSSIDFCGFRIDNPIIDVVMDEPVGAFASSEIMGNLGNTLFRHFVLYLDYNDQKLIVEKGANFEHDFPVDKSGLQIWMDNGQPAVHHIAPGTPAEKAGFKNGDLIRTINGIEYKYLKNLYSLRSILKGKERTEFVIGITRDEKPMELKLKLRDLY